MRIEQGGIQPEQNLEILTGRQGAYLRKEVLKQFKTKFYIFSEFEKPLTLFSAQIINRGGLEEKMFVVTIGGKNYAAPYDVLDLEFIDSFQASLDADKPDNPVNFFSYVLLAAPQGNDQHNLRAHSDLILPAFISDHHLTPGWNNTRRVITQTEIYNPETGGQTIENWRAIAISK